jgi:UDP-N-acetylmuramate dehydrogenase
MATVADKFAARFGTQFKENEPLSKHVNFRIGGPAKFFVEARSTQDLVDAVKLAYDFSVQFFILGGGSNTLVADKGFVGLVIKAANRNLSIDGNTVIAEAGVISASMARLTADKGLRGFEWAISLPGTIGGAVRGNAGCFGGETKDQLVSVKVLRNQQVIEIPVSELNYGYRHSLFKESGHEQDVILEAKFELESGDRAEALATIDKHLAARKASQPLGSSSAGCMFKNFEFKDTNEIAKLSSNLQVPESMLLNHRIGAGWLIDQLDLKGLKIGEAQVAPQHGNFLLNLGHASAQQVMTLISVVKTKVMETYGIKLQEEVQILGDV